MATLSGGRFNRGEEQKVARLKRPVVAVLIARRGRRWRGQNCQRWPFLPWEGVEGGAVKIASVFFFFAVGRGRKWRIYNDQQWQFLPRGLIKMASGGHFSSGEGQNVALLKWPAVAVLTSWPF